MTNTYNYQSLIQAYVNTHRTDFRHPEFRDYYRRLLTALEQAFGVSLNGDGLSDAKQVFWHVFENSVKACCHTHHIITIHRDSLRSRYFLQEIVKNRTNVPGDMDALIQHGRENLDLHFSILYELFNLIYGTTEIEVTSNDLLQLGFDDREEISLEFLTSWDLTEAFYIDFTKPHTVGWDSVRLMAGLIAELRLRGYDKHTRAGNALVTFILSRSKRHGLQGTQARLSMDATKEGTLLIRYNGNDAPESRLTLERLAVTPELTELLDKLIAEPIT